MINALSPALVSPVLLAAVHSPAAENYFNPYPEYDGRNLDKIRLAAASEAAMLASYQRIRGGSRAEHITLSSSALAQLRRSLDDSPAFQKLSLEDRNVQLDQIARSFTRYIQPAPVGYLNAALAGCLVSLLPLFPSLIIAVTMRKINGLLVDTANPQYTLWVHDLPRMTPAIAVSMLLLWSAHYAMRKSSSEVHKAQQPPNATASFVLTLSLLMATNYAAMVLLAFDAPLLSVAALCSSPVAIGPLVYKKFIHPLEMGETLMQASKRLMATTPQAPQPQPSPTENVEAIDSKRS